MEGLDQNDDFERLFLLEFLINSVQYSNSTMRLDKKFLASLGQTCVQIKFLSYPMMEICEEDFCPGQEPYEDTHVVFKSGKSCLFSLKKTQCVPHCMNICITVVRKKEGGCGEDFCMGTANVNLGSSFTNLFNMQTSNSPLCKSLKETYCLVNSHKETIGTISLFVRLSCFGKMIVTQFQVGAEDQSYMFKASSDVKTAPPCGGDNFSTPVIHQGMPPGAASYGVDMGMMPMFGMGAPGMGTPGMGAPGMGMQGMGMPGMGMQGMGMQGMGMQGMGMQGMGMQGMGMQGMGMQGIGMPGMGMPGMQDGGMQGVAMQGLGAGMPMDPSQAVFQGDVSPPRRCPSKKKNPPSPPPYPFCQRVTIGDTESEEEEPPQQQLNLCDCDYPVPPGLQPPPPPPKKKKKKVCCPLEPQPGDYCLRADCPCGFSQPPWMVQEPPPEPMPMEKFELSPGAVGFKGKQVIFQMNDKKNAMSNDAKKMVENTQYKVGCGEGGKGQRNVIQVLPDPVECVPPPDPDRDIFILKVGKRNDMNEKAKMEIELKSPKYKDNTPQMTDADTQWLASDVPPAVVKGAKGKGGKGGGKGGKGGKGKKK